MNLEDQVYGALMSIASKHDAPLAWVVRRAVLDLIDRETLKVEQPSLPLMRSDAWQRQGK